MFDLKFDSRVLLVYFAVKYQGDLEKILTAFELKNVDVPYDEAVRVYESLPCKVMTILDYDYPKKLLRAYRPPLVLFYYGDISLLDQQIIGTVGSRDYSEYGKDCTEKIIKDLTKGRVIISGLARGIDTIAHQCAIDNGGRTIAVLGSGLDNCYPPENRKLYDEIKEKHLLLSEYPFKAPPSSDHFPMRNRIIVALADAMLVPQINSYASGTMISLSIGLSLGKPIYIVPHPPGSETINNNLINEGAVLADSASQILEDIGWAEK